jgi:hypothetical protein
MRPKPVSRFLDGWAGTVCCLLGVHGRPACRCKRRPLFEAGIAYCESRRDYIGRELLEDVLESGEEHINRLEKQLELMAMVGIEAFMVHCLLVRTPHAAGPE